MKRKGKFETVGGKIQPILDELQPSDEIQGPVCPYGICDGYGHVRKEDQKGTVRAHQCRCKREFFADRAVKESGIPRARLESYRLENFKPANARAETIIKWIREKYLPQFNPEHCEGLWLYGPPGRGKSHIAAGLLQHLIRERNLSGRFWNWSRFLSQIRRSFNSTDKTFGGQFIEDAESVDVLVIDDLGAAFQVTPWALDQAFEMISLRYDEEKTTIITSNLNWKDSTGFSEVSEMLGEAFFSRLKEIMFPLSFDLCKDYRDEKTPEKKRKGESN